MLALIGAMLGDLGLEGVIIRAARPHRFENAVQ